ncbi:TRAP transporter small permease [Marinobacterium aestuariivivens]|uniref:TRAP transporter small permease protein n=1 Tax=Marinobacterium aestuariivivens TaxID=1698799 RepID=A0ABW1ZWQ0_9GAMM
MDTVIENPPLVSVNRCYHRLLSGCGLVAALSFASMALLVCGDILLRNLTAYSMPWTVEVCEYLLMSATMLAAPWLLYCDNHIRIDIVLRLLPLIWRIAVERAINLLGMLICGVLTAYCLRVTFDSASQGSLVFKVLVFPEWWLNLPMIVGFALLALEFGRRLFMRSQSAGELC